MANTSTGKTIKRDFRELSRIQLNTEYQQGESLRRDDVQLGAILRISDAMELMAKNHSDLIAEKDRWKRRFEEESQCCKRLITKLARQKGVSTKLKNKLAQEREVIANLLINQS